MRMSASSPKSSLYFCLMVFVFSFFLWLMAGEGDLGLPINLPASSLMAFFPLATACIIAYGEEKGKGVMNLFNRVIDFSPLRRKVWYFPALLLMPAALLVSYLFMSLMDSPLPEPELHLPMIPVFFAIFFIGAVGEEVGWMAFVVDPLQQRWSALTTGIVCGAIWAVWHIVPWIQAGHDAAWIVWHGVVTVFLRIIIVWIYNNTGYSVLMAILFHASANIGFFLFPNYGSHYDPMVTAFVLAAIVGIITFLWGFRTLSAYR
ncbi:MAG: CPBP family intramembrane glutamic endopeptidase, partial [Planifilum fimeticola]